MTVVLDSWALMRFLEGAEPAASRVQGLLDSGDAIMSWINLGEIAYVLERAHGADAASSTIRELESVVRAVLPDRDLVLVAATIKARYPLSYADAFAAALAVKVGASVWTGDSELMIADAPWRAVDPSVP